jgi:fumarate reductase subunit D
MWNLFGRYIYSLEALCWCILWTGSMWTFNFIILKMLVFCNFSKHKVKTPWGWYRSTETCSCAYKIHKEKSKKMQQCIKTLLFRIYIKLNMFRATHRPSSALTASGFLYVEGCWTCSCWTLSGTVLFHIYIKHNMFPATHRPTSGA